MSAALRLGLGVVAALQLGACAARPSLGLAGSDARGAPTRAWAEALVRDAWVVDLHDETVAGCLRQGLPLERCPAVAALAAAGVDLAVLALATAEAQPGPDAGVRILAELRAVGQAPTGATPRLVAAIEGADVLGEEMEAALSQPALAMVAPVHIRSSPLGPSLGDAGALATCPVPPALSDLLQRLCAQALAVDLSHAPNCLARAVLADLPAGCPVLASHSAAAARRPSGRNLDDDVIQALGAREGLIGIPFYPALLTDNAQAGMDDVADHAAYVAGLAGWDHVALGTDLGGFPGSGEAGAPSLDGLPDLVLALASRGASEGAIRGVLGENARRFLARLRLQSRSGD